MPLSTEELRAIARLARLDLTAEEEKRHADTISAVLDYMKILSEVETGYVEPTAQVTGLHDIVRDDKAEASPLRDQLIQQMPAKVGGQLKVPGVFSEAN